MAIQSQTQCLFRVREAAVKLALSKTSVYELINAGVLKAVKIGRSTRITATAIEEFLERLAAEQEGGR